MAIEFTENYLAELTQVEERSKSNSKRLDEAEADIQSLKEEHRTLYEMSTSIKTLTDGVVSIKTDVKEIKTEQGEMKSEIQDLKNAPIHSKAKAFDTAWKFIATAVGGAVVGWLITMLLPQIV